MARIPKAIVAAGFLAGILSCSAAQAGPPGSTVMISRPAGFGALTPPSVNDSFSGQFGFFAREAVGAFSANPGRRLVGGLSPSPNRYTVFVSSADGLFAGDDDTVDNIYVRDGVDNTTTLVSRATDGTPANGNSRDPALSSDGRYAVFASDATNLVPNVNTNGMTQIYERDLVTGTTALVSRAGGLSGAAGNGDSSEPSVSTNGLVVAFASSSTNLGASTVLDQVYVRDGLNTLIASVPSGTTTPGSANSRGPSLSDDGTRVAFTSDATNIGVSDNNASSDVFVHNLVSGATTLASVVSNSATYGNDDSSGASISADGHRVAFSSVATNLDAADATGDADVYVHDFTGTPSTVLVSRVHSGAKGNDDSTDASISADGTKVAFMTASTNLSVADTNGVTDVYVNALSGVLASTFLASRCQGGALLTQSAGEGAISPNGGVVSFDTLSRGCTPQAEDDFSQVFTRLTAAVIISGTEPTTWVSRPSGTGDFKSATNESGIGAHGRAGHPASALSGDGSVAVFASEADELSPDDNNAFSNIFVRENKTGATELISRASGAGGAAADGPSGPALHFFAGNRIAPAAISDDGRFVAFESTADNLVANDSNGHSDIFVRDRLAQTTTLVSVKSNGLQISADATSADISADGTRVAFVTDGVSDPADSGPNTSVYVRDLSAGTTTLASRQSDPIASDANEDAFAPAISGDGTHVAFVTKAGNLAGPADSNTLPDAYVRDLATHQTQLGSARDGVLTASTDTSGRGVSSADLDFSGEHLAFASDAPDLVAAGDANGLSDVYLRTLGAASTALVSKAPGGAAGNGGSVSPSISGNGNRIAFATFASDLLVGDASAASKVVMRDVAAGTLTLVSRADGAAGAASDSEAADPSISSDGHCVAFDSRADNLVAGPPGTDFLHAFMRAIDADCGTPPPPPAPGPGPGSTADTVAPVLTGLKLSPATFRLGSKATAVTASKRAPKATKIKFSLSEAAKVSLRIERKAAGRKKGKKCVAKRKTGRRCTRYVLKGTLKRSGKAGANSIAFSGRIGAKKLAKGRYRVRATAIDAAGNRSVKKTATFRIV